VQRSGAVDVEGGFQPGILPQVKPWLRRGLSWASGDGNPNDNIPGTFFQLLPSVRPYAPFPFQNMMNMHDAFGRRHPLVVVAGGGEGIHRLRYTGVGGRQHGCE
jgi:hypothetical protein